ncbi:molybdopterin molybdotransferase MoeA [Basilea psittacipulmonis]|uniref:Molybdopterin molybdenumtransferase n=1 Tax=Basilea psittacipulmonis DSM 24701 TaxID=1072685 RepID=A0A077DDA4_9BURK|nr:gephyrin-like molybdotransferase Glp [Basilea psittacipulmonis]AIL32820.1 molybdopterin biosynthesis MoeA protein [Basilea psittacipulmonis DSM 24701]
MSELITVESLQKLISENIAQSRLVFDVEAVPVSDLTGRVLAEPIVATLNIPNADISAMDGYALCGPANAGDQFQVIGESIAGKSFEGHVAADQAVRIMTGAHVPADCHTVIIQENVLREGDTITLQSPVETGKNIRYLGEVVKQGNPVFEIGRVLSIGDILMLASLGYAHVKVYRKVKVAVFSTGSELQEVGTDITNDDMIFDSNRQMIMAKLKSMNAVEVIDCGSAHDSLEGITQMLDEARKKADVVITSGGASVGDYDFIKEAVEKIGTIHHYKVAMKPGKPFVFGALGDSWYFGLPGNPVSGFAGFEVFVRHAITELQAKSATPQMLRFPAVLTHDLKKSPGRKEYQRARIEEVSVGQWQVTLLRGQDSHNVLGASQANAFAILPADGAALKAGESIMVQPFKDCFL